MLHWVTDHVSGRWRWEAEFPGRDLIRVQGTSEQLLQPCVAERESEPSDAFSLEQLFFLSFLMWQMSRIVPEGLHQYSLSIYLSVSLSSAPFFCLTICHDHLVLLFGVIFSITSNTHISFCPCWKGLVYSCLIITLCDRTPVWSLDFIHSLYRCVSVPVLWAVYVGSILRHYKH